MTAREVNERHDPLPAWWAVALDAKAVGACPEEFGPDLRAGGSGHLPYVGMLATRRLVGGKVDESDYRAGLIAGDHEVERF
ncbi:MAG TPA: hypothetical protein DCQ64_21220 [Candidatus Rokubacteria bacterium]|nr:hypothetical protein [Candidatus Rokubacteria bacterium]